MDHLKTKKKEKLNSSEAETDNECQTKETAKSYNENELEAIHKLNLKIFESVNCLVAIENLIIIGL